LHNKFNVVTVANTGSAAGNGTVFTGEKPEIAQFLGIFPEVSKMRHLDL
jgi:hypothetical protein